MKTIVIFGANGRTGKGVSEVAQARGIVVRAFDKKDPSMDELRQMIRGADAAVIVFGPVPPYSDIFCAESTGRIIEAMKAENVRRLICQTGAMIGDYRRNRSFFFEIFSGRFRKANPAGYADRVGQEDAVKKSALEWTLVKPPRLTTDKSAKAVVAGEAVKAGLLSSVSRVSLARFIVDELTDPRHVRKAVFVKN